MKPRAKKSLGQNFLRDEGAVTRIVDALDLSPNQAVVEIGPGLGALTEKLVEKAGNVIAIEFDRDLIADLNAKFAKTGSFRLVHDDVLNVDLADLLKNEKGAKLVANLPYNISTPVLQKLIDQRDLFARIVLMFQREVVERIAAKPGNSERGFLTVLTENAFDVERLFDVPPGAFQPVPKVWSSVVRLTPRRSRMEDTIALRKLASLSFGQKRKTLLNNLKPVYLDAALILDRANIAPNRRAESLELQEWADLLTAIGSR